MSGMRFFCLKIFGRSHIKIFYGRIVNLTTLGQYYDGYTQLDKIKLKITAQPIIVQDDYAPLFYLIQNYY